MNVKDRDLLFGRLDERSRNTWAMIEKMETHLVKLNDSVAENTHFRKMIKPWFVGAIVGIVAAVLRSTGLY